MVSRTAVVLLLEGIVIGVDNWWNAILLSLHVKVPVTLNFLHNNCVMTLLALTIQACWQTCVTRPFLKRRASQFTESWAVRQATWEPCTQVATGAVELPWGALGVKLQRRPPATFNKDGRRTLDTQRTNLCL